jgi:DnaJ-class molecular chaperone
MLVETQKIKALEVVENACPKCDGTGKVLIVPLGIEPAFEMGCNYCFGEKTITQDLFERKQLAQLLKKTLKEERLTVRMAASKFDQSVIDWLYALSGRSSLEEIKKKINLFYA